MTTRQQRIQQERERQQKEAAARRQLPDRPIGAEAIDAIEQDIATFTQLPGVRQTLNFVGGAVNLVNEAVLEPARYAATDPSQIGTPMALAGSALIAGEGLMDKAAEGGERIAERLGVDPRIGGFVGGSAAETLLTAGVGTAGRKLTQAIDRLPPPGAGPQFAMAGAAPMRPMQVSPVAEKGVYRLTITDPEFIAPGVRQGIAETPANVKARQMLDKSIERLDKRRTQLEADVKSGKVEYKGTRWKGKDKKIREERYGEMSSFYNQLDQDPPAFNVAGEKHIDPTDITMKAEQHHLAAKAQTAPFIEAMLSVGDPDDLVALHEYSRMLGVVMGNSKKNMLDAPGPIHRAAVAKTAKEKAGNIHSAFSVAGMEPNNAFVKNLLKDAETADDVMRVFKQYADEYLIPQQDIAKKIVKNYLSDYRIKLTPAQKAKFDELASKLN